MAFPPPPDALPPLIVAIPFAAGALVLTLGRYSGRRAGLIVPLAAVTAFAGCMLLLRGALAGQPAQYALEWLPALDVQLAFRADPFGLLFALLISGIGTLVGVYSTAYMPALEPARLRQYYAALLAFMGAMLGVALADDLVVLFVFWEITSVTSFLLIGFWREEEAACKGALTALQVTALGGMVMMAGIVLIGTTCGTFSISRLVQDDTVRQTLAASPAFAPALLLLLAGALTKSAQWPFHFWLPAAMVAPTPISAYLHAATMVKAGIFLLGRMLPVFATSPLWSEILVPIGLVTFLMGGIQAMRATDLKAMLARTTVATLGAFTFSYGLGANAQDALQIFSHATYKGALFLVAGIIEHATHTRDVRRIAGLRGRMPITFVICLLAALSMAGIWPTLGYHAKELSYEGVLEMEGAPAALRWPMLAAVVFGNALLVAVALNLVAGLFFGSVTAETDEAHDPPAALWAPAALLSALAFVTGLVAPSISHVFAGLSSRPHAHLHLHFLPSAYEFFFTAITTVAGIALYLARRAITRPAPIALTAQRVWDGFLDVTTGAAMAFSRRWQNGSVYWYFSGTLAFAVALCGYALWTHGAALRGISIHVRELQWYGLVLCAMLAASAVMVVRFSTRLAAAIALTSNGFLTALLFVVYRSPDILLTQILIETVSTIFILLILYFMPPFRPERWTAMRQAMMMAISGAVGALMFAFVLLSTSPELRETRNLALDYLTRSKAEAGGANAVNVIIVDMRAIDTNGEITVLMIVGLLVFGLLRARREGGGDTRPRGGSSLAGSRADFVAGREEPILRMVARIAIPLTAWVSFVIFMQGHNLPGGGFVAGVMGAAAGAMYLLAFGVRGAGRVSWWKMSVLGLIAAVTTGAVPFALGGQYMNHEIWHLDFPLLGPYELPTATFFDLGVYLIVLGTIMTIFVELGQERG